MKKYLVSAFLFFIVTIVLGSLMRYNTVFPIHLSFKNVLHTHSHIAFLGWIHLSISVLIFYNFLSIEKEYSKILFFILLTIVAMTFTFPVQGYGFFSIISLVLFILASYVQSAYILIKSKDKQSFSFQLLKWALFWLIVSSVGPFSLGYIISNFGRNSEMYRGAIYFYLHFQYNGWIFMALLSLFFRYIERKGVGGFVYRKPMLQCLNLGVFLSVFQSFTGIFSNVYLFVIAGFGLLVLGVFLVYLIKVMPRVFFENKILSSTIIATLVLKWIMQVFLLIPSVSDTLYFNLFAVIGYLHWNFLGWISISIIYLFILNNVIEVSVRVLAMYVLIFFVTEFLIFAKVFCDIFSIDFIVNYFREYLFVLAFASSVFMVPSVVFLLRAFQCSNKIR